MRQNRRDFMKTTGLMAMAPMAGMMPPIATASVKGSSMKTDMVSSRPFDYSHARKWAPKADVNDFATVFPQLSGVISQEKLLALADKEMGSNGISSNSARLKICKIV